ncbi:hypothetical protein JOQ06_003933, partial [Pogonophryne albipinna]
EDLLIPKPDWLNKTCFGVGRVPSSSSFVFKSQPGDKGQLKCHDVPILPVCADANAILSQLKGQSRQGRVRAKGSCGPHGDFIMAYFQRNETAANKDLHKDKQQAVLEFFTLTILEVTISHTLLCPGGDGN